MNALTPYEQQIGEQLANHLPLPNLEDAIWGRIKAGLDADMPETPNTGGSSSGNGLLRHWHITGPLGAFIVIVVTVFFYHRNQPQPNNIPAHQPTPRTVAPLITPNQRNNSIPLENNNNKQVQPPKMQPAVPDSSGLLPDIPVSTQPVAPVPDSASKPTTIIVPPTTNFDVPTAAPKKNLIDTLPPKKKRGVPIDAGDYKLVPKTP
ncbi:MAG: hypothetical protein ACK4HE_03715 [Chitinophagaceae bacterium]|jgi:hypothetical protein